MVRIYFTQCIEKLKLNSILIGIITISIFLNFYNVGERAFQQDEAIYSAQSAIMAGHDGYRENFLPYSRSATNFQVQQFITSISFRLLGISEFSARLPSAIMGVLSVIMVYLLAEKLFNKRAGLFSAFIMAVNGYVLHFSRQMQLDTGLTFFIILSVLCLVKWCKAREEKDGIVEKDGIIEKDGIVEKDGIIEKDGIKYRKDWYFYLFLISAILAIMAKVVAIFIIVPLAIVYLSMEKELKNSLKMMVKGPSLLIIILSLLFIADFIILKVGYDEFLKTFLYATDRTSEFPHEFYITIMRKYIGYIIPGISLIGLIYALKYRTKENIFSAFWFLYGITFFSIYPLKAYSYILPIIPAVCLLCGMALDNIVKEFEIVKGSGSEIVKESETNKTNNKIRVIGIIFILLILIVFSIYPTYNVSYAKLGSLDEIGPEMINRFNPIKDYILRDTGLWLKENVDSNSKVAVSSFTSHHGIAFYSGLETYTIDFVPGYYIPINKTATIVWNDIDTTELIKNGQIDYIVSLGESNLRKTFYELKKEANINFIGYYNRTYQTPYWFRNGTVNVTVYKVERTEIRFITVGDLHVKSLNDSLNALDYENRGNERLEKIVNFINNKSEEIGGVDFVIFVGDMTEFGTNESNDIVKNSLRKLKKPYYVVVGNHDITISQDMFKYYYGYTKHVEKFNDYQLIFIGMNDEKDKNGIQKKLFWSFPFDKVNKDKTTLVFIHGPVLGPPPECEKCDWNNDFFGYGQSMQLELDKFANLMGVYSGHVHYDSDQTFKGKRYITINGLVKEDAGGIVAVPSNKIGYTVIKGGKLDYKLISYEE